MYRTAVASDSTLCFMYTSKRKKKKFRACKSEHTLLYFEARFENSHWTLIKCETTVTKRVWSLMGLERRISVNKSIRRCWVFSLEAGICWVKWKLQYALGGLNKLYLSGSCNPSYDNGLYRQISHFNKDWNSADCRMTRPWLGMKVLFHQWPV